MVCLRAAAVGPLALARDSEEEEEEGGACEKVNMSSENIILCGGRINLE